MATPGRPPGDLAARLLEFKNRALKLREELSEFEHTEVDQRDGGVGVVVDSNGKLIDMEFSEELLGKVDAYELAERTLAVYEAACKAVEDKVRTQTKEVFGKPVTPGELTSGDVTAEELAWQARRRHLG